MRVVEVVVLCGFSDINLFFFYVIRNINVFINNNSFLCDFDSFFRCWISRGFSKYRVWSKKCRDK